MNEQNNEIVINPELTPTPVIIKVMLIFTYISFGFQLLGLLIAWLMKDFFYEMEARGNEMGQLIDMLENTQYVMVHLSALILGITGAVLLWRMKKTGLYLYLAAKLVLLTDIYAFGIQNFSMTGFIFNFIIWVIWPVVFIIHYKQMR